MRVAYMNPDNTVREIIPDECRPVEYWYNAEFASHCMEIPDYVSWNWEYDPDNEKWYEPGQRPKQIGEIERLVANSINNI